jgi:hypothetical protein
MKSYDIFGAVMCEQRQIKKKKMVYSIICNSKFHNGTVYLNN